MTLEPWQLAMLEECGYMDTKDGLINRVARCLANRPNDMIDMVEFRSACIASGVDPDSFTQSDLKMLKQKLCELT